MSIFPFSLLPLLHLHLPQVVLPVVELALGALLVKLRIALDDQVCSLVEPRLEQLYFVDDDLLNCWHRVADGVPFCRLVLVLRVDPLSLRSVLPHLITRRLHCVHKHVVASDKRAPAQESFLSLLQVALVKQNDREHLRAHLFGHLTSLHRSLVEWTANVTDSLGH